ncbi:MAG: hypothetical protein LBM93_00420 [Oscillospiraceae bacterium]|jgi:hypothetical protein|nr:hypothetical protein [Oscillospiraceae bacterium]
MRKYEKKQISELLQTLKEFQNDIKNHRVEELRIIFNDTVFFVEAIQNYVRAKVGKDNVVLSLLNEYKDVLVKISVNIETEDMIKAKEILSEILSKIKNSVYNITVDKIEVLFLPYKTSMADSLESIWQAAMKDPQCDCYICPIPYYDMLLNGQQGQLHYEGFNFDKNLPLVDWKKYNIEEKHPDIIFIHNPYDNANTVTNVHSDFFSPRLKKFCDYLVYVPYFILPGVFQEHFAKTPGVVNSDLVVLQNEEVRKGYIDTLVNLLGLKGIKRTEFSKKFIALGTPKTDKIINTKKEDLDIPKEWLNIIGDKKVVFFNTNVSMMMRNSDFFIENLRRIFGIFNVHKEFTVIWREHPLTLETLQSMRPQLFKDYIELRKEFIIGKWGILDETPEPYLAMILSDCYFGSGGSLSAIYPVSGKPIMAMSYLYPEQVSKTPITLEQMMTEHKTRKLMYLERAINSLDLFLENIEIFEKQKEERIALQSTRTYNLDGSVGQKIYDLVKSKVLL